MPLKVLWVDFNTETNVDLPVTIEIITIIKHYES